VISPSKILRRKFGLSTQESQHGEHAPVVLRGIGQPELVENPADVVANA
jgi:hypothetical protein